MIPDTLNMEQIYKEYFKKVSGYVYCKVSDKHNAEDLVSEVFLKICTKLDTFDETKASLATWIYHITQNTVTDYFRKRQIFSEIPEDSSSNENVEDNILNEEALESLADALEKLDEKERSIIVFHYYSGKKLKDIADTLDISYVYAKILHKKALDKMKKLLSV